MLGTTVFRITTSLDYDAMLALLGPEEFLFSYADNVYMEVLILMAVALSEARGLYAMVGLKVG